MNPAVINTPEQLLDAIIAQSKVPEAPAEKLAIYHGPMVNAAGDAHCYRMIPPFKNNEHIIVSRANTFDRGDETMIFAANAGCVVTDFLDLAVWRPGKSQASALFAIGYKLVK